MPRLAIALFCLTLAACGEPGGDTVFVRALPGRGRASAADSGSARGVALSDIRAYRGMYLRTSDESRFQPCGTSRLLDVTGTNEGRALLNERFRWNAMWLGRPMFAVLQGVSVLDTLERDGAATSDSLPPDTVRHFFITGVDTLRTWENECPGMRIPR